MMSPDQFALYVAERRRLDHEIELRRRVREREQAAVRTRRSLSWLRMPSVRLIPRRA